MFKKKELKQNSRWKRDDQKQNENKFKKPRINSRFGSLISDDNDSETSRFRDSEPERRGRFRNSEPERRGRFRNSEPETGERQGNRFKNKGFRNNGRFRNNRRFDKRPSRISQDTRGNMVLPGATQKGINIMDSITTKPKQTKKKKKEKKKKNTDFDFFAEEEKTKKNEDNEWQKALLLKMQYETDSENEGEKDGEEENWEDSYDEFSKDNFTQQFL